MRPSRTSYGYLAPSNARVRGWRCRNDNCGVGDEVPPYSWPATCPQCGTLVDPTFEEPWAHEARFYELRHALESKDPTWRLHAEIEMQVWAYEDAWRRNDRSAAARAWTEFRRIEDREGVDGFWISPARYLMVDCAVRHGDVDPVFRELLAVYPCLDTSKVEDDNTTRTTTRSFISQCTLLLESEASVGHPLEGALDSAMRDIARRIEGVMMPDAWPAMQRTADIRAFHRSAAAIAEIRRSDSTLLDDLPPFADSLDAPDPDAVAADAAVRALRIHDDSGPLDALVERLGKTPLGRLLEAHRRVATRDLQGALDELDAVVKSAAKNQLQRQAQVSKGVLIARIDPERIDEAVRLCRNGRSARRWQGATAADTFLAKVLLWRARQPRTTAARRAEDIDEALKLARRRCRSASSCGLEDLLVQQEAEAAASAGRSDQAQTHKAWSQLAAGPWSAAEKARAAAAWVEWAMGTRDKAMAGAAYQRLVALVVEDCGERHSVTAKQRVLATAQEYAEEAGYWLARSHRYREAVLALEAGRAVGLSETLGRETDNLTYADVTAETGEGALVYMAAAKAGGYALVVASRHDPQFVDIPRLDRASVAALLEKVLPSNGAGARATIGEATAVRGARDAWLSGAGTDPVMDGLRALWTSGVRDLLMLNARGRVVTFIPVGLLSLLPLHAAGELTTVPESQYSVNHSGHFSAIRYTPNVRALRRCRETARELAGKPSALLAVDVPDGHDLRPETHLRHVAQETQEASQVWKDGAVRLIHGCTWKEFRDAGDDHSVWHLACHGSSNPRSIMETRLYFADRDVSLDELRRSLRPSHRRLAVLSACETNLIDTSVPNELVGLPSALIRIGFAGVVAAAWRVDDLATAYLMTAFYRLWCREGVEPVVALNRAQVWLRSASPDDLRTLIPEVEPQGTIGEQPYRHPRYWAAFAYTGA